VTTRRLIGIILGVGICAILGTCLYDALKAPEREVEETSTETLSPKIELLALNIVKSSPSYFTAEGQVRNISGERLEHVVAVVTYYTADGTFVTSDDALIDYDPILPNQISPFDVITTYNPAIEKASIEFKFLFGGEILYIDRR